MAPATGGRRAAVCFNAVILTAPYSMTLINNNSFMIWLFRWQNQPQSSGWPEENEITFLLASYGNVCIDIEKTLSYVIGLLN